MILCQVRNIKEHQVSYGNALQNPIFYKNRNRIIVGFKIEFILIYLYYYYYILEVAQIIFFRLNLAKKAKFTF